MKRKILLFLTMFYFLANACFADQYDYNPVNSPGPSAYDSDTYTELGWTTISVSETDVLTSVVIDYTYSTSWASEGSFHLKSPIGTYVEIASGESSGTYNHTLTNFNGEAMNGNWILWIEDSYGDGGNQATDITISFHYVAAGAPSIPSNPNPAVAATGVATSGNLTWDFGADTDTYDLWFGEAGNMSEVVTAGTAGATGSYAYTDLTAGATAYEWQVIAHNASKATTSGPVWSFFTDATVNGFPYLQNFDGTWSGTPAAPIGWKVVNANSDSYLWSQANTYISPTHSTPYAAHGMGNTDDWLITPPIDLTDINTRISWWDKVESATRANKYKVYVSNTTNDIASFTVELGDYTCTNTAWAQYFIDLSAYTGQTVYIGFHQYASAATNYGFGIDDFEISEILAQAPETATIGFPSDGLTTFNNPLLSWTPSATGEPATGFKVYLDDANPPTTEVYDGANTSFQTSGLTTGTQYYWKVVPYNATGDAIGASVWSFTTVADGFLAESFENTTFPPTGWANPGSWSRSTSQYFLGVASAYKFTTTTASLLRTPMVSLTGSSTLKFFAKTTSSNTSQRIQVKHSTDGTTWTNIGDEISLASAGPWTQYSVDLSSLAGNNYYLAIAAYNSGSSGSVYLDHVIGPMITPLAPNAVTLTAPADAATNQSITPSLSWTAAATGGVPTGYIIYLDQNADPTTLFTIVATSPYTVSPALEYATTYYWKVVATNGTGDAPASAIRSFTTRTDPTLTPPFTEEFGTFPPSNWTRYAGLLADPTSFTGTSTAWLADGFANVGTTGAAKINIYGTIRKDWLITPPINLGDGSTDYRLTFDLALTAWNSTGIPQLTGTDDKFAVVISTDNGVTWTSINTLKLWDNAGSANVYNSISNTGENVMINLSSYSGIVQIGFYGESTVSNADNDLFVDNVTVEEIPTTPVFAVSPESKDFGTINVGESSAQTFTISNTGAGTLQITGAVLSGDNADQFTLTDINAYPVSLTTGQSITVEVTFEPDSDGAKTASLDISDNLARGIHNVPLSGNGYTPPQGSICSNPLPLTLPANNVTGNTVDYGDDYSRTDISPPDYYLNGDDVVYQFTLPNGGLLEGTITTTAGTYIGAFILTDCPNPTTPPTPVIQKTSTGKTLNYSNDIAAGTYFLIISSYPSPQSLDYTINLSLTEYPAACTWTGSTDNDWHTAGNWDNGVPGFTTDVIIPAGLTNYPTLLSAGACNDLLIASTATGTASLLDGGFLTVNGNATIQRYISGGGYHNVSVPLDGGATAAAFMNSYLRKFNASGQAWVNITEPGDALSEDEGYLIWYSGSNTTYEFTGDLISGDFPVATPAAASVFSDPYYIGGYNLVPNPYPSAIDWNAALGFTESNLFGTIWIFDRGSGNYGAYVRDAGSGTNDVSNIIPVGQSFFVQASTTGIGSLTINQAARTHSANDLLKDGNLPVELLKLKVVANNYSDELIVQFSEGSSMAFEGNRDAQKLRSPGDAPQLYSLTPEGTELSINTIPFSNETIIIPVGFELAANTDAVFNFTNLESFDPNITIFLEDLLSGKMIDVREQQVYTFTHDEGNEALRFRLHFKNVVGVDEQQLSAYQIWSYDSKVYVSIPALTGDKALIQLIDAQGKVVYEGEHHLSNPEIINVRANQHVLIARIITGTQVYTQKVFIR